MPEQVYQNMISDVSYSYWHESPMVESYQIIRTLDESHLATFCNAMPGISAWSFIYKLDSMLRECVHAQPAIPRTFCAADRGALGERD